MTGYEVRPAPCAFCPYRRDVPSGVWAAEEYAALPQYDGEVHEQYEAGAFAAFDCHKADGTLCAGWVGCHGARNLLALRLVARHMDPSVWDYESPVPLLGSGAEAALHGLRELEEPGERAMAAIRIIARDRARRGQPVAFEGPGLRRSVCRPTT